MLAQFRLDGKRVLITGASSGLGHAIAVQAATAGAEVILTGRNREALEGCVAQLPQGARALVIVADLTSEQEIDTLVAQVGHLDGIVHSAGIKGPAPIRVVTRNFLQQRFEANYFAPVLLTRRLLVSNHVADGASILFMASIAAHTGTQGMSIYSATKASLVVTAKCLGLELARRGIRVNCLSPAVIRTPIFKDVDSAWLDEMEKRYPLGFGTPADVANAARFFMSDASRWITGETLIMDGACGFV